ncbi:hypothetical protein GCM10010988_37040 [Cnuibacter physcomitrellae]|nr:hypothetical protein GCM10010988_37040 [Cnuibacter physcomitrellae]
MFAWAALATALLVGAGVTYLAVVNNSIQFDGILGADSTSSAAPVETPTPTPTVTPAVDPQATVTVLNGTDVAGLAGAVGQAVVANGWAEPTVANASETDVATSTVYYADPAAEAAALAMSQQLGIPVSLSSAFPGATLTVVIGADYAGPGSEGLVPSGEGESDTVG